MISYDDEHDDDCVYDYNGNTPCLSWCSHADFTHHIDHLFGNPKATKSLHQDHEALCCNNYGCFCYFGNSKPRWKFD